MDEREIIQHYNYGYALAAAQEGMTPDELVQKKASITGALSDLATLGLVVVPAAGGVLTGMMHNHMTAPGEEDLQAARDQIVVDALNRETDNVRRRTANRKRQLKGVVPVALDSKS